MIVKALHNHWFERPWPALPLTSQLAPFDAFRNELERLVFGQDNAAGDAYYGTAYAACALDLADEGPQFKLTANLPGISEKDLTLNLTSDSMVLRGERKLCDPEGYKVRRRERRSYTFERSVRLPAKIDPDKAEAKLINGVLTVTLPKAEAARPRSIAVQAS